MKKLMTNYMIINVPIQRAKRALTFKFYVMKRVLAFFLSVASLGVYAQAPAESEDIMLQGFYWDSQQQTGWTQLTSQAADIAKSFNLIWLPPSASAEGGGAVGGNNMG